MTYYRLKLFSTKARSFDIIVQFFFIVFIGSYIAYAQDKNDNVKRTQRVIFIFNLAQQVSPSNIDELKTYRIGVLGSDPTVENLQILAKKRSIFGKPVIISRFQKLNNVNNIQLLYVNNIYRYDINAILQKISGNNILLVTEDYNYNTSMINMINVENSFEYEINAGRIENENFVIAPSLKSFAITSSGKWKKLYESTQVSLSEVKEENKQQESLIRNKEKEIKNIVEKVEDRDELIENLSTESELQRKKYKEKVLIEESLEKNILEQLSIINDQKNAIENQKKVILESNDEIEKQQDFLGILQEKIEDSESTLLVRTSELNAQKKVNWLLIILATLFFITGFVMYKGYVIKKKLSKKLGNMNSEIKEQAAKLELQNKELRIKNYQINKQSKKLESQNNELEQFAYIASHDLQEPLNTMSSFIGLLVEEYGDKFDETGKNSLLYIDDASIRMKKLIQALLEYSRLGRSKDHSPVNCNVLLDQLQADLHTVIVKTNAKIKVQDLPEVNGSEIELRLLFQNLISNAIKFTKPEVKPEVFISCQEKIAKPNGDDINFWEFLIKDNGIGIPEKQKNKIFDIFQRLHTRDEYKGTGIGLAHCKKIVESHGGNLWIDSKEGIGSTFHFTIPKN